MNVIPELDEWFQTWFGLWLKISTKYSYGIGFVFGSCKRKVSVYFSMKRLNHAYKCVKKRVLVIQFARIWASDLRARVWGSLLITSPPVHWCHLVLEEFIVRTLSSKFFVKSKPMGYLAKVMESLLIQGPKFAREMQVSVQPFVVIKRLQIIAFCVVLVQH